MGLLNALFGKKNDAIDLSKESEKFRELIGFVSFVRKTKPLTGGNYGIYISYNTPGQNEYISNVYATFGFYDFNEIKYARDFAINSYNDSTNMVHFYYKNISERAGLSREDWPYGIDEYDFREVLQGVFGKDRFIVIPDEYDADVFTFKVAGGFDTRNASQVSGSVFYVLKSYFPELQISQHNTTPYTMGIKVQI